MYKNHTVSVVIPCYNEEEGIAFTLKSIPAWVDEVLVVDNNSYDQTAPIARKLGATIIRENKQGYGAACRKGFKAAKSEFIITGDADGTYPFAQIDRLIDYLLQNNLDFVGGNRFPLRHKTIMPWPNLLGNSILTWTMNILTGRPVKDSQTGMWIFRRLLLNKFHLVANSMSLSEEIKMEALCHPQIKYGERHIEYADRIGVSKLRRLRDGIPNLLFLFKKRWLIYRSKYA